MSIIDQAKRELAAVNFGDEDSAVMLDILHRFFDRWDSGGAVAVASDVLARLIKGQPLTPLTGEDGEWFIHDYKGMYAQNLRCSSVFKATKDGPAYDIDAGNDRAPITFPYDPQTQRVRMPVYEIET